MPNTPNHTLRKLRPTDSIEKYRRYYFYTENLNNIWAPHNADFDEEFLIGKDLNEKNIST